MDTLLGLAGLLVLISVPVMLGLIYLELRQRRMFGPRSIISNEPQVNSDTAAIAMSLQAELERLRADFHLALNDVSTDLERVYDRVSREQPIIQPSPPPPMPAVIESPRIDPERNLAISELYAALSKLDVAFLAVASPVLLPGEEFDPAEALPTEAFLWESWNDVGAAAYQFAEVFSERRISLDAASRDELNNVIRSIRQSMTEQIYPALTDIDGSIPEDKRPVVATVVATLASDIRLARRVLEQAAGPS